MPTNEREERERQRIAGLAEEDMRKEILASLTDVRQAATPKSTIEEGVPIRMTLYRHAAFLAVLSRQADIQTRRIVRLTWALVGLTAVLLFLTGYLCYDAYLKTQREKQQHEHASQPNKSNG
jgi:hypothetical protein